MNLIFDIGNTATKIAVYDGDEKKTSLFTKQFGWNRLKDIFQPYTDKIDRAMVSTVRDTPEFIIDLATHGISEVHVLSPQTKLPFRNAYETPETLGSDRIAAIAGAYYLYPGRNVLIIDAGSAVTYDYLAGKTFIGGNISPGLSMRFKALHRYMHKFPFGSTLEKYSSPGKNILESLAAGVIDGLIYEINDYIGSFQEEYIDSMIIMTGGDSGYLKDRLGYNFNYQPDLVLDGLNHILEYNSLQT